LLRWLHKRALSSYIASSTDALSLIKSGRYNCLSSCILYGLIAERIGLSVKGVVVDKHAFCKVLKSKSSRSGWDVETTTPFGFAPGRDIKIANAVVSVPRSQYRNRREVSLLSLIGLIYTNHMGLTGAFPTVKDKLLAYQKAILFNPSNTVIQNNILAAFTQVIQRAAQRRRWAEVDGYLKQMEIYDTRDEFRTALAIEVVNNRVNRLINLRDFQEAYDVLNETSSKDATLDALLPNISAYLKGQALGEWSRSLVLDQPSRAVELFDAAIKAGSQAARSNQKSKMMIRKKTRQARSRITEAADVTRTNYFASIKNTLIRAVNNQRWSVATEMSTIALTVFPKDRDFRAYLRQAKEADSRRDAVEVYQKITERAQNGDIHGALQLLDEIEGDYTTLKKEFRVLRKQLEPIKATKDIINLLEDGELRRAKKLLRSSLRRYPRDRNLRQLEAQLDRL